MKIVTWNINGIRTFKNAIKTTLDSFDADIICVQETKVTRDLLDERTAIVEGYNSYFSFSRGRSGYSGVATFCKDSATPFAAEEGLTGLLNNIGESIGNYGDQKEFSTEELQLLDNEGRAVITQHQIMSPDGPQTLAVVNVYCPRADPEKPERKLFKLQFYQLLQMRAEALLSSGSHVIVLGDINTSHRPIDHCDPDDVDNFEANPGRKWLNSFLFGRTEEERDLNPDTSRKPEDCGGKFVDTFRFFHPSRLQAFTCWSTLTGARQTNYGTRIDYIFANRALAEMHFLGTDIMPEVEGSDHCPVWGHLGFKIQPSVRCPPLCTRYMPEFTGKQQKLSRFLVKMANQQPNAIDSREAKDTPLPGSQETEEIRENLQPAGFGATAGRKRGIDGISESSIAKGKKSKLAKAAPAKPQGSLLAFFKPKGPDAEHTQKTSAEPTDRTKNNTSENPSSLANGHVGRNNNPLPVSGPSTIGVSERKSLCLNGTDEASNQPLDEGGATPLEEGGDSKKETCPPGFWKTVLRGPPPPPPCKVHGEPCVLRTVKKAGPNMGRQFFVCARPQGHASNPQARCNFFVWVDKGK